MMPVKADPVSYDVLALAIVFLDSTYTRVLLSCIAKNRISVLVVSYVWFLQIQLVIYIYS